jgi:predicted peroxiredoxin/TusA-related sulfurtransferase
MSTNEEVNSNLRVPLPGIVLLTLALFGLLMSPFSCAGGQTAPPLPPPKMAVKVGIDVRGKTVTAYIISEIRRSLDKMEVGEVLEVVTERFAAIEPDLRTWCRMTSQPLRGVEKAATFERYYIEKAPMPVLRKKVAMVISDAGLEELLSPLGLAMSAALAGADVHLYFQGPAVHVLEKGFKPKLSGGLRSWFSGFARKALEQMGQSHPHVKLSRLLQLGAHIYVCGPSLDYFGVDPKDFAFSGILISEYPTFIEQMLSANVAMLLQ